MRPKIASLFPKDVFLVHTKIALNLSIAIAPKP